MKHAVTFCTVLLLAALASPALAQGECPAHPDDVIGQILCGEIDDCSVNAAWGVRSCYERDDYICCSGVVRPRSRLHSAVSGATIKLFDASTGALVDLDQEAGERQVTWAFVTLYEKGGLVFEDVLESGPGSYRNGELVIDGVAVKLKKSCK